MKTYFKLNFKLLVFRRKKLEESVEKLVQTIINTCNQQIPQQKLFKKSNRWWSQHLSQKRKQVKKLRRQYQRTSELSLRHTKKVLYYSEKVVYEKLIKTSKIESWKKFCFESKAWGLPFKLINYKVKTDISIPNFLKNDGNFTQTPFESMEYVLKQMFPFDDEESEEKQHKSIREYVKEPPNTENDLNFTLAEINEVINNLKPNETPGWDSISNEILKNIHNFEPELLLLLFNKCLNLGYFPKIWKISVLKILLKSEDKAKHDIKSYRPISLLCFIAKVLEKLIINRINHFLYKNKLLSENQFGFTPQKCTENAIKHLIDMANKHKKTGFLLVIILDIRAAFDNCWWPHILKQLKRKRCPKNLYKLVQSYLSDRYVMFKVGELIAMRRLTKSCPQGSALGPGLWNINYNELLELKTPENSEITGFCDDTKLLFAGKDIKIIEKNANELLQKVYEWGKLAKLDFNAMKSSALLITNKRSFTSPKLEMNGIEIKLEKSIKYLGVKIYHKLNWSQHIDYICNKTLKTIMRIPIISRNTWGLSFESLKLIYNSVIESSLLYCSSIWGKNIKKYQINKLKKVQRLYALKMIRAFHTISYESAITIAVIIPIELKINEIVNLSDIKISNNCEIEGLLSESLERKVSYDQRPHPAMTLKINFIDSDNSAVEYKYEIFSDGSKIDSNVGLAFVVFENNIEIRHENTE
jgi:hypothetical protein